MGRKFVGFFWTYPVTWANFTSLPKDDVDGAAKASRTVAYQKVRVAEFMQEQKGELLASVVLVTDQAHHTTGQETDKALDRLRTLCGKHDAVPVFVDFSSEGDLARRFYSLSRTVEDLGGHCVSAVSETLNGEDFNPFSHFKDWQARDKAYKEGWKQTLPEALAEAMGLFPGYGRWIAIAGYLNARGILSKHSKVWDADMVRKAANAMESIASPSTV